jgi:capsular exopolysaccharide synthesis family protein
LIDDLHLSSAGHEPAPTAFHAADGGRTQVRRAPEEPHLLDYVRMVVKRRHVALTAFVIVAMLATVYTFTATAIYEGRVQLLIEADDPNVVNFAQVIDEAQSRQDYYQTQYRLLESRSVAKKTIETLNLWKQEEFTPDSTKQHFTVGNAMRGATAWLASLVSGRSAESGVPGVDETAAQAKTIDKFLDRLTVTPVRNSRLVEVSFRLQDPKLAVSVANTVAKSYIEQNLDFRFTATRDASAWLEQQLAQQRKAVETAEARLQQYREQNETISFENSQNIVVQKLTDLNSAVTKAKTERLQKESMYRQLITIQQNPAELDTFPAILANEFIQQQKAALAQLQRDQAQMSDKLGERHPDMIKIRSAVDAVQARLHGEIAKVVQAVRTEYQAALAQEQSLTRALDAQRGEALSMNRKAIDYGVLDRDVESSKQIYQTLLQRAKETGISGNLKTSNVRVVDSAELPDRPVSPRHALNLLLGLFGGAFFGIGLAFFFEYLDNTVKTPEEIETHLGLPSLGLIPALAQKGKLGNPLINNGVPAHFAEAFRALRTNILFSATEDGCRSIVVTSTAPSEGKTMVAGNLAIGMAQASQRVLLIDADMRRPRTHEVFNLAVEPGLSNLLVGNAKASEVVQRTQVTNLWVLPAGKTPPNPAELLGSKRFAELLGSLKAHFDVVVIDTPPVMAVTDAAIVAHRASGVLFVIAADQTSRHAAQQALDQLEQARGRFIGAVLNRVDLERHAYYYARYYRKDYANYYSAAAN